jgi:sugar/nucleoside kinase (ribokinase family)
MKIVCVGDCGIDHYLPSGEQRFGGITANVVRHARTQFPSEDEIHLVSCIGDDEGARLVMSELQTTDVECHIQRLSGSTPVQYIEIKDDGERDFVRYDEGVLRDFTFDPATRKIIADSDVLIAPVYLQIVDLYDDLMAIDTRGLTAIDFADFLQHPDFELLERHLDSIDVAFFGLSVADVETVSHIRKLAMQTNKLFIVTLGDAGSRAFIGKECVECPVIPVNEVVDTTGAGDAYAAAFLSRYCHGGEIIESMHYGASVAANVVGKLGSWS